jgi:hypothetical protein
MPDAAPPPSWPERAAAALRDLGGWPVALLCLALALNGIVLPYSGVVDDAQLYGVQVLNRVQGGTYADDLYLRYGSQDQYSAFSAVAAPLVRLLGLQTAFFILYLTGTALLLLATQRLVAALAKDGLVVSLSVLYTAVVLLPVGGLDGLHVNERFLTPRLLAVGLSALGLERMLGRRPWQALALLTAAGLLHPLMTAGAVLVFAAWVAVERLGWRKALPLAAPFVVAVICVLAVRPLGERLLGRLDDDWRGCITAACPITVPTEWEPADWVRIGVGFGVVLGLALFRGPDDGRLVRFGLMTAGVGALGLLASFLACWLPYALLIQGQAFRALWLLRLVEAPIGLQLALNLWRRGDAPGRVVALAVAAYLAEIELAPAILAAVVLALGFRVLRRPGGVWRGAVYGLIVGCVFTAAHRCVLVLAGTDALRAALSPVDHVSLLLSGLGWTAWAGLAALAAWLAAGRRLLVAAAGIWLAAQAAAFLLVAPGGPLDDARRHAGDMRFVGRFLQEHGGTATVYCPTGDIGDVWFTARARCYFDQYQLAGNLFRRETAVEGRRRAELVARFERERFDRAGPFLPDAFRRKVDRLFGPAAPPPTADDLAAVCREPGVDYVVLERPFDGLPRAADNGRFFIYDCAQVRAVLRGGPDLADNAQ